MSGIYINIYGHWQRSSLVWRCLSFLLRWSEHSWSERRRSFDIAATACAAGSDWRGVGEIAGRCTVPPWDPDCSI